VPRYLDDRKPKWRPRYYSEVARQLERDWKPLHGHAVDGITRQAIVGIVDDISTAQGDVAADRARTALGGLFGWAIERGYCDTNPTMNISPRAHDRDRDRVLTESEIVEVWRASGDDDYGSIVKLLILTGQRRQEIGDLGWPEIDLEKHQIDLPGERTKNHRPHVVPISGPALAVLARIPRRAGRDLLFGLRTGGFSGWSKAKAELEARINGARKLSGIDKPMPSWHLHDLRRTFVTCINELGFAQPHVVEAAINHVSGHLAGVAGVYNKAAYLAERRQALETWGAHVAALVEGLAAKVVPMRRAR
jgi:integrase